MRTTLTLDHPLLEGIESYSQTSITLFKLKSIDTTAEILSMLLLRSLQLATVSIFILILSITISLLLGKILGEVYYGFLVTTLFYAILSAVILLASRKIKNRISNAFIIQMLK